jgi:hypothetical protein
MAAAASAALHRALNQRSVGKSLASVLKVEAVVTHFTADAVMTSQITT